ncbi:hypothetical protein QVD17_05447 [Tagetes erecta]|uniref:Uncharacterized protein n=1 Tax=Tagetes erecta TaxID=13708 RepID=A0AAD8LDV0_TARER|nr:hypothetical protein QVD17_05447 [Tagetes erecta]
MSSFLFLILFLISKIQTLSLLLFFFFVLFCFVLLSPSLLSSLLSTTTHDTKPQFSLLCQLVLYSCSVWSIIQKPFTKNTDMG